MLQYCFTIGLSESQERGLLFNISYSVAVTNRVPTLHCNNTKGLKNYKQRNII